MHRNNRDCDHVPVDDSMDVVASSMPDGTSHGCRGDESTPGSARKNVWVNKTVRIVAHKQTFLNPNRTEAT